MIRNSVLFSVAVGGALWGAAALAQNDSAAPGAATPSTTAAPAGAAASTGDDTIHLHMPTHRRVRHASPQPAPAETPTLDAIGADTTTGAPPAAPAETQVLAPVAPPTKNPPASRKAEPQSAPAIPFSFGEGSGAAAPPPPPPQKTAASQPRPVSQTRTASLPPKLPPAKELTAPAKEIASPAKVVPAIRSAKHDDRAGLTKRGAVLFDRGVSNPSAAQFDGVKLLATDIAGALEGGAARVQLEAYGGAPGDKSSDAHRLSLKRALAVRQLLIDGGIPSNRIDVRAMGGVDDKGPGDRVDVFLRAS